MFADDEYDGFETHFDQVKQNLISSDQPSDEMFATSGDTKPTKPARKGGKKKAEGEAATAPTRRKKAEVEEVEVNIKEFDLNWIPPQSASEHKGCKIAVIGGSGSGKSTLVQSLLASKAHIAPVIQIFNGSEENNATYHTNYPPIFVHDKLDINAMIEFKKRQTIAGKHLPENSWAIQIIDDCMDDPKMFKHPVVQAYYKQGRHWHMIHILCLQYCMDIMPSIRQNIDFIFILKESSQKMRKKLYEDYCPGCVETFADFNALMDELTTNYGAIVINRRATSTKIEDMIFYYKADPDALSPAWKFGHQTAWDFSNERYDENAGDPFVKD